MQAAGIAMNFEDHWDIETDLGFLISLDAPKEAGPLQIGEHIPSHETKLKQSKSGNPFEIRKRQELRSLQRQVQRLEDELEQATLTTSALAKPSPWKTLARQQKSQARKMRQENKHLKDAVCSNKKLISKLTSLVAKRPRVERALTSDWGVYKLEAQSNLRQARIHSIADRQYDCKDTEFILAGLIDNPENFHRIHPVVNAMDQTTVKFEVARQVTLPAPFYVVGQALWKAYSCEKTQTCAPSAQVIHERVDDHTVYERFTESRHGFTSYANTIRKYYVKDHEHLIVLRSVLEDALTPEMIHGVVVNESAWHSVVPLEGGKCRLSFLLHFVLDTTVGSQRPNHEAIDAVAAAMRKVHGQDSLVETVPGYDPPIDQLLYLKETIKETVNFAVRCFNQDDAEVITNSC
ncbi:unnamed protein product [Aphanomyces euteiches]